MIVPVFMPKAAETTQFFFLLDELSASSMKTAASESVSHFLAPGALKHSGNESMDRQESGIYIKI